MLGSWVKQAPFLHSCVNTDDAKRVRFVSLALPVKRSYIQLVANDGKVYVLVFFQKFRGSFLAFPKEVIDPNPNQGKEGCN